MMISRAELEFELEAARRERQMQLEKVAKERSDLRKIVDRAYQNPTQPNALAALKALEVL